MSSQNQNPDDHSENDAMSHKSLDSLLRWAMSSEPAPDASPERAEKVLQSASSKIIQVIGAEKSATAELPILARREAMWATAKWATAAGISGILLGAAPTGYVAASERKKRSQLEQIIADAEALGLFDPLVLDGPTGCLIASANSLLVSGHASSEVVEAVEVTIGKNNPIRIKPTSPEEKRWKVSYSSPVVLNGEYIDIIVRAVPAAGNLGGYEKWLSAQGTRRVRLLASPLGLTFATKQPLALALGEGQVVEDIVYINGTSARTGWLVALVENPATAEFFLCATEKVIQNQIFSARMNFSAVTGTARVHIGFQAENRSTPSFDDQKPFTEKPAGIEWFQEILIEVKPSNAEMRAARVVFSHGGEVSIHAPPGKHLPSDLKRHRSEAGLPASFTIQEIYQNQRRISMHALMSIRGLSALQGFYGPGSGITDEGAVFLAEEHPGLRWIRLNGCPISDRGIQALSRLKNLELLEIVDTGVSDDSIDEIASMRQLRELHVTRTKITESGIQKLRELLPSDCKLVAE